VDHHSAAPKGPGSISSLAGLPAARIGASSRPARRLHLRAVERQFRHEPADFQLQRRFRSGISANAVYSFSKSIDDASTQGGSVVAQNWQLLTPNAVFPVRCADTLTRNGSTAAPWDQRRDPGERFRGTLLKTGLSRQHHAAPGSPLTAISGGNRATTWNRISGSVARTPPAFRCSRDCRRRLQYQRLRAPAAGLWGDAGRDTIPDRWCSPSTAPWAAFSGSGSGAASTFASMPPTPSTTRPLRAGALPQ